MNEIWREVKGYEGLYDVSNIGNVRSLNWRHSGKTRNLFLKTHRDGYKQVELFKDGKKQMLCVHRIVAEAFLDNPENLPQVNHKNYDRSDNSVANLEWCSASDNCKHEWGNPKRKHRVSTHPKRAITQLSLSMIPIREWVDCLEIKKTCGMNQTSIWECCDKKRKTAYGYIWRYADEI